MLRIFIIILTAIALSMLGSVLLDVFSGGEALRAAHASIGLICGVVGAILLVKQWLR